MNTKSFKFALASVLALAIVGCGGSKKEESPAAAPAATSSSMKMVDEATAGIVTGSVTLDGKAPAAKPINMSAEPYCQKAHSSPVVPPEVVVGDKGQLANVVIFVKDGLGDYMFHTPADPVTLNQQGCMYDPHVIALMAGQTLSVKNSDQTTHNIHPMPKDNRDWNKSQAPGAPPRRG